MSAQRAPACRSGSLPTDPPAPVSTHPPHTAAPRTSGRRAYLEWVEERVEGYKETLPRAELLDLAEEVIRDLETSRQGQYQLTEVLLCSAIDRRIVRLLKLPSYRSWASARHSADGG